MTDNHPLSTDWPAAAAPSLLASLSSQPLTVAFPQLTAGRVDWERRQLRYLAVPYGVAGNTSVGRVVIRPGAVRFHAQRSWTKLLNKHSTEHGYESVGFLLAEDHQPEGVYLTFQLGNSPAATAVLQAADDGSTDGVSVELSELAVDGQGYVTDGLATAFATVPIPAFANARLATLAAATTEGEHMEPNQPQLVATESPQPQPAQPQPAPQPAQPQEQPQPQPQEQPQPAQPAQPMAPEQPQATAGFAQVPAALATHTGGAMTSEHHSDADLFAALHRVMTGTSRPELEAALADITNTNVYGVVGQSSYVGRLWAGQPYQRRFVPLLRQGNLTSWQVKGWKWGTKPEVDDYAGDKTEIPSNVPTVLPASTTASRLAGGHDLDRKFRDFGDTEFIAAYLEAMAESYAKKSDLKALAFILASATDGVDTPAGGDLIQAAILASDQVEDLTDGVEADYVLVNRGDVRSLLSVTNNEAAAYAAQLGFSWDKLKPSNQVPAGQVIAGTKAAGTFYELQGSPIRVEAIDIARGGIDEALFGYWATLLHDARGIVRSNITA